VSAINKGVHNKNKQSPKSVSYSLSCYAVIWPKIVTNFTGKQVSLSSLQFPLLDLVDQANPLSSTHIILCLQNVLILECKNSYFPTKIFYQNLSSDMRATWPNYINFLYLLDEYCLAKILSYEGTKLCNILENWIKLRCRISVRIFLKAQLPVSSYVQ